MLIVSSPYIASTFICYYLSEECYRNGTRAYLKLHPTAKYQSAKASASRLLKKLSVQQALKRKMENVEKLLTKVKVWSVDVNLYSFFITLSLLSKQYFSIPAQ